MKYLKKHIILESKDSPDVRYNYLQDCFQEIVDDKEHSIEETGDGYNISLVIKSIYDNNIEDFNNKLKERSHYTDIENFDIDNMIDYHSYMFNLFEDLKVAVDRFKSEYNNYKFSYNFYDSEGSNDKPMSYIVINIIEE